MIAKNGWGTCDEDGVANARIQNVIKVDRISPNTSIGFYARALVSRVKGWTMFWARKANNWAISAHPWQ